MPAPVPATANGSSTAPVEMKTAKNASPAETNGGVEIKKSKRQSTMPTPPSPKKAGGFFSRHLGRRTRRSSSVSFTNAPSAPSPQTDRPPSRPAAGHVRQVSQISQASQAVSIESSTVPITAAFVKTVEAVEAVETPPCETPRTGTPTSYDGLSPVDSKGSSKKGIQWAANVDGAREPRERRQSSNSRRRSSIYFRAEGGEHEEGADFGAGSKARRLSVALPEPLDVDECPLEDHFSLFSRLQKKHIGEGGAATVQLMQSKTARTPSGGKPPNSSGSRKGKAEKVFAVKEFRAWDETEEDEGEYRRKIKSEYAIAKSLEHPNIVETYRLCYSDHRTKWYHVMEYCDQGDLNDIINLSYFSREDRDCMFKQLLRGVEYLHSRGVAHRDIKSENLLLSRTGALKIADFGTSEVFSGTHPGLRRCRRPSLIDAHSEIRFCKPGLVGSRPYMAPEIVARDRDYDPRAVDVWSCAIVYISLILGATPWEAADARVNNYNIYCNSWEAWLVKNGRDATPSLDPEKLSARGGLPSFANSKGFASLGDIGIKALILGMLHPDPRRRVLVHEALGSKVVVEMACCQQEGYSDDIRTRQRKAAHDHCLPTKKGKGKG